MRQSQIVAVAAIVAHEDQDGGCLLGGFQSCERFQQNINPLSPAQRAYENEHGMPPGGKCRSVPVSCRRRGVRRRGIRHHRRLFRADAPYPKIVQRPLADAQGASAWRLIRFPYHLLMGQAIHRRNPGRLGSLQWIQGVFSMDNFCARRRRKRCPHPGTTWIRSRQSATHSSDSKRWATNRSPSGSRVPSSQYISSRS